jgi:hypothetical protein
VVIAATRQGRTVWAKRDRVHRIKKTVAGHAVEGMNVTAGAYFPYPDSATDCTAPV